MDSFDISRAWVILAPFPAPAAAEDLARRIGALRERDGVGKDVPAIMDAAGPAPEDSVPIIVLNMENASNERGGYTWRSGQDRVEIYGDSPRGLCNGIYSFLAALGFRWPGPGQDLSAPSGPTGPGVYPLKVPGLYVRSDPSPENRRRLVIPPWISDREIPGLCYWAVWNRVDALVFSLKDRRFLRAAKTAAFAAGLEKDWGLIIERGGWDMGFLIPRSYFLFRRDLFRMEGGTRTGDHHFCPTNPESIRLVRQRMAALFERGEAWRGAARANANLPGAGPEPRRIYHLWPDRGAEHLWCACPACRAFSPREQIRLVVNTAAAFIAEKDPQALVSCREQEENPAEQLPGGSEITPRPNVFVLKTKAPPDSGEPEGSPALYTCGYQV
jgi:hypothetical protein